MRQDQEPAAAPEPHSAAHTTRTALIGLAACALVAWGTLHVLRPGAADNAAPQAVAAAEDPNILHADATMAVINAANAPKALADSGYSTAEQADILAAVKRHEVKLVAMPVYDATGAGGAITIVCGPWQRTVSLLPTPTTVILPIAISGAVDILPATPPGPMGTGSGAVTVFGPQALPVLYKGNTLSLTVLAQ